MFTFSILYASFYIIALMLLLRFLRSHYLGKSLTQLTFAQIWQGIVQYTASSWLFRIILFQIAGLPPVFLFFVKFNFLIDILKFTHLFIQVLAFLNLLLGMFFYIRVFSNTNRAYITHTLKVFIRESKWHLQQQYINAKKLYVSHKYFIWFIFFSMFSVTFFFDFFILIAQYQQ